MYVFSSLTNRKYLWQSFSFCLNLRFWRKFGFRFCFCLRLWRRLGNSCLGYLKGLGPRDAITPCHGCSLEGDSSDGLLIVAVCIRLASTSSQPWLENMLGWTNANLNAFKPNQKAVPAFAGISQNTSRHLEAEQTLGRLEQLHLLDLWQNPPSTSEEANIILDWKTVDSSNAALEPF